MEKEARTPITEEICRKLELMMKGGADGTEAARLVGISQSRASRIKKAGFNYAKYRENDTKEREEQRRRAEKEQEPEEEEQQVPGQIEMDLTPEEEQKPEMSDQTKLMRFQAGQYDEIKKKISEISAVFAENNKQIGDAISKSAVMLNTKLAKLNDTLSMILRVVRKE